MFIIWKIKRK